GAGWGEAALEAHVPLDRRGGRLGAAAQLPGGPDGDEAVLGVVVGDDGGKGPVALFVGRGDERAIGGIEEGDDAIGGAQVDAEGLADLHAATRPRKKGRVVFYCAA